MRGLTGEGATELAGAGEIADIQPDAAVSLAPAVQVEAGTQSQAMPATAIR